MTLTPDERKALLGLLSLLLLGQGAALLRDERRARPDRELSAWLTQAQAARAESLRQVAAPPDRPSGPVHAPMLSGAAGAGRADRPETVRGAFLGLPSNGHSIGTEEIGELDESTFDSGGDRSESVWPQSGRASAESGRTSPESGRGMPESDGASPESSLAAAAPIEPAETIPAGVAAAGRIAINRASARDLEALPGVGPALAKRIVEERERSGPFRSPRDLLRVKGIGPKKQVLIQDRVDWSP